MSHNHNHNTPNGLTLAFWLNLGFSIIELVGGILTNSKAIIADSFHDFIDAMSIGIAVWLEKYSTKKRSTQFSYGYRRFSLLAALGMSVFLLVGAGTMIYSAVRSFANPAPVHSLGMLGLALLGIAVNGFAYWRIQQGGHGHAHAHNHSHSHDHDDTNQNSKAVMLHLLEDVLGWIAVLVGSIVIYFTGRYWIDAVLTLGIAGFIGYNASRNLIQTMKIFLQSTPDSSDMTQLESDLSNIPGVAQIHDLHVWSLDGSYMIASVHAVIDDITHSEQIRQQVAQIMKQHHINHPTIQIESSTTECELHDH